MIRIVGWLLRTIVILALVLSSVGTAAADEDDPEGQQGQQEEEGQQGEKDESELAQTFGIHATGQYGNCFSVTWNADPTMVVAYKVSRPEYPPDTPAREWSVPAGQHTVWACEMEPGKTYEYEVCAHYGNEKADTGCATAPLTLERVGNLEPGGPLPTPVIDPPRTSPDNFGVGWKGFYDYDFYYVDVLPKGGKWNSIKHDDDGDWGWQGGRDPGHHLLIQGEGLCDRHIR